MEHEQTFVDCIERLKKKHGSFKMDLSFSTVVMIIAQLQLAFRHPGNVGFAKGEVRRVVDRIINALETSEPEIGPILRMGDDPSCDVPHQVEGRDSGEETNLGG